jgi:hypothetical protein
MGLLSATGKAAKKLADEWDEAAWLKENPRPDGTKRSNPEVKRWMDRRKYAKNQQKILKKKREAYAENPEKMKESARRDYEKNRGKRLAQKSEAYKKTAEPKKSYQKNYRAENKEKISEQRKSAYQQNRPKKLEQAAQARAQRKKRNVDYSNREAIQEIHKQAGLLSEATGTPYEVDHVIPLQGKTVSGLHVPGNLMITPKDFNRSKNGKFTPGDDPMRFNAQAEKNIAEQNAEGLLSGIALPSTAGLAGLLAAGQSEDADAGFVTRGGKTLLEAWHGGPNKIDGSFRLSDKDVGIHLADNESLATNAAVKSGFERGIGRDQIQTAPYLIDANGNQVHKISASSNRFDAVEIIDELIASGKINKARGSQMIDEILEIEDSALDVNEYLKSNLEDASGIRALEYKNSYDAGPTWEDIEKGVFESDVKPAPSYMVFNPDYIQKGNADSRLLAGIAGTTAAGLAAPMVKDSGFISAPRSEGLMDLTMAARGLERRLEGSPASLLFPEGLVNYLETVNRRTEDPNAMTRIMGLVDLIP